MTTFALAITVTMRLLAVFLIGCVIWMYMHQFDEIDARLATIERARSGAAWDHFCSPAVATARPKLLCP